MPKLPDAFKGERYILKSPLSSPDPSEKLEVVLKVPGVEMALELRAERKAQRDREDAALGTDGKLTTKILHEQDDGEAFSSLAARTGRFVGLTGVHIADGKWNTW